MTRWRPAVLAVLAAALVATGCGSSHHSNVGVGSSTTATTSPAPSTTAALSVTVPDCGAGAYKPATLLIVCGNASTMATSVTWSSWTSTGASGAGDVHLAAGTKTVTGPATLALSDVVNGNTGPQFSLLQVTWTGTPPDGHPVDTFHLSVGSS